jgi:hypothetical protein
MLNKKSNQKNLSLNYYIKFNENTKKFFMIQILSFLLSKQFWSKREK